MGASNSRAASVGVIRERECLKPPGQAKKSTLPSCAAPYNEWISHREMPQDYRGNLPDKLREEDRPGAERYRADMEKLAGLMCRQS